jgi:dCMP deaminase
MTEKDLKYHTAYLRMASEWSTVSCCSRKKVGAIIVKDGAIISDGFNGVPKGFDNTCEDKNNKTHWYVLHAEANAILKVSKSTQSTDGATLYVTMSPCENCAKLIIQSGITKVFYKEEYRDLSGIEILKKVGVETTLLEIE